MTTRRLLFVCSISFATLSIVVPSGRAAAADATVDLTSTKQLIRGFGASSAWNGTISTAIMDSLYKTLGYSILRVRIEESIGDAWSSGNFKAWDPELANAKNAIARGAIVFASPWNPPASMKSNGKLSTSKYADYANYLKAYAKYFSDNGASLYAISIQNEPDYADTWTAWTATDLLNFLKAEGAALSSAIKVMMPESFQFRHPMSDPSLNDATVAPYISIIGGHLYGAGLVSYPLAQNMGKELWETEHYFDDDTISNIMKMGKEIHDCMVVASMNAYTYWWIIAANGLANSGGSIYKRAYVLGQFAKYIRPGYHRVDATASPATGLNVSAYQGDDKVVIVAVNTSTASVSQNFVVRGGTVSQISSWQTTSSDNMMAGQSYQASGGSFTATLPAQSITTLVGSLSGFVAPDGGVSVPDAATVGRDARDSLGIAQDGSSVGTGGAVGNGGALGAGGRSGTGGTSGTGGAASPGTGGAPVVSAGSGGSVVLGGTGGSAGGGGASTVTGTGGAGHGGSASTVTGTGGAGNGGSAGSVVSQDTSSGCSCALGGRSAGQESHGLWRGSALLVFLLGLVLARRRAG